MEQHLNQSEIQQIRTDMKDMKGKVDKMYYALMGNELSKDGGLVRRIEDLETTTENHSRSIQELKEKNVKLEVYQKIMWTCIGGVAMAVFSYVLTLFK